MMSGRHGRVCGDDGVTSRSEKVGRLQEFGNREAEISGVRVDDKKWVQQHTGRIGCSPLVKHPPRSHRRKVSAHERVTRVAEFRDKAHHQIQIAKDLQDLLDRNRSVLRVRFLARKGKPNSPRYYRPGLPSDPSSRG